MVILQLAIIFAFLGLGEIIVATTGIPIPSSIMGMLALVLALQFKIVRPRWVSGVSQFLTNNLGFFFIPAGVSLMLYFDVIAQEWLAIVVAAAVSTAIVILVTGRVHQYIRRGLSHSTTTDKNNVGLPAK